MGVALLCNVLNNLPVGLLAGNVLHTAQVPETLKSAVLIGIDLGPNLSVTGSLATILWLVALRRENVTVSASGLTHQTEANLLGADLYLFRCYQGLYAQPASCFFRRPS